MADITLPEVTILSRSTVADGNSIQKNTIGPLTKRDEILKDAISSVSGNAAYALSVATTVSSDLSENYYKKTETSGADEISAALETLTSNITKATDSAKSAISAATAASAGVDSVSSIISSFSSDYVALPAKGGFLWTNPNNKSSGLYLSSKSGTILTDINNLESTTSAIKDCPAGYDYSDYRNFIEYDTVTILGGGSHTSDAKNSAYTSGAPSALAFKIEFSANAANVPIVCKVYPNDIIAGVNLGTAVATAANTKITSSFYFSDGVTGDSLNAIIALLNQSNAVVQAEASILQPNWCTSSTKVVALQEALEAGDGISIAGNTISCSGTLNAEYNYSGSDHTAKELRVMSGMAGNNTLMVSDGSVSSTFALPSSTVTGLLLSRGSGIILGVTPTGSGVYGLTSGASFSEVTNNKSFTMAMQWDKSITTSTTGPAISPSAIDSAEIKHNWTSDSNFNFSYNASTNRLQIGNPNGKTVHCVATLSILPQVTEPMTGYFGSSLAASNETEKLPMTNYTKNEFYDFSASQSNITQKQLWMCDASGNSKAIPTGTYRCELVVKGYYA